MHLRRLALVVLVVALAVGCSPSELRLYPVAAGADVAALEATRTALQARVQALGHEDVAVELGSGPSFVVKMAPADAPPGLLRTLATPGKVTFVAIPADVEPPLEGTQVDPRLPELFGPDAVERGSATKGAGPDSGSPTVDFRFTEAAADVFRQHTRAHVGEYFAIVVDGTVISVPVIQDEIPNGQVSIQFGDPNAQPSVAPETLAAFLNSGPLPIAIVPPPS